MSTLYSTLQNLLVSVSFPFWSYLVLFAVAVVLVLVQHLLLLSKTLNPYFKFLNEFLASVAWVVWSLENAVVGSMWSKTFSLITLGIRLLLGPLVMRQAHSNPCNIVYQFFTSQARKNNCDNGGEFLLDFIAEVLAIPAGLGLAMTIWSFLADYGLSYDHSHFIQEEMDSFLSVPLLTGFAIEITVSFFMFMPGIFLPRSKLMTFAEVIFILFLIILFGPFTGAFMNPMVASSYLLMWHYRHVDPAVVAVHLFVFWLGPLIGSMMAVGIARSRSRKVHAD